MSEKESWQKYDGPPLWLYIHGRPHRFLPIDIDCYARSGSIGQDTAASATWLGFPKKLAYFWPSISGKSSSDFIHCHWRVDFYDYYIQRFYLFVNWNPIGPLSKRELIDKVKTQHLPPQAVVKEIGFFKRRTCIGWLLPRLDYKPLCEKSFFYDMIHGDPDWKSTKKLSDQTSDSISGGFG